MAEGKSKQKKNVAMNAAEAAVATIEQSGADKESFVPMGRQAKDVQNTIILDPTDSGIQGHKEVFLIKTWDDGTIYYIDPDHLDTIDRRRLTRALRRANKSGIELWAVLKDTTLSNSKNALDYFHQLVRTMKPEGALTAPTAAQITQRVKRAGQGHIERGGLADGGVDAPNSFLG